MDPVSIILTTIGWLASPIFKKAADVAWQQFTKRVGLQAEIDGMVAELKSFKLPNETAETREYLKEVKGLISEAKDLLDELEYFQLQDEVKKKNKAEQGTIFTKFKLSDVPSSSTAGTFQELKFDKSDMSKRMKDVIKKLKMTCASSPEFGPHFELLRLIARGIQNMNNQTVPNDRQTNAYQLPKNIYGRDDQIEEIQQLINDAEQHNVNIPVIAIVGNGGVGKTTLAQQVYSHSKVESYLKIWICVSTIFDEKEFTRQMLECCSDDGRKFDGENLTNLKSILISELKYKKVLLVLDDIWAIDKTDWDSLLNPFNLSNGIMAGSIVLVTTRFLPIAKTIEANPIIKLDGLDASSFWSLFKSYVFDNDQIDVPDALENIGRRIVHRLGGSPLAAKTVGGLLKDNIDAANWKKILESEEWKLLTGKNDIMPTLRLSYEYLPIELKRCFSYCSLFPKDHYFKAYELVYMWIAQDFITTDQKKMEDVGFTYLNKLVERGFFERVGRSWVEEYVLHDLMHDLAQDVSKEEIFIVDHPNPIPKGLSLRHVSFTMDVKYNIENQFQNLSSLVIFENAKTLKDTLNWHQTNILRLRLLILPVMSSILYNFIHLRYLKLYFPRDNKEFATLPIQICRLYHLQVLHLGGRYSLFKELPKKFNNLVNLRHFIADKVLHSKIAGVGRLKCLRELKRFVVREEKGFELDQLSELNELRGSLELYGLQNVKRREVAQCVKLSEKKIVELEFCWGEHQWDKEIKHKPLQNRGDRAKWRTWINGEGKECKTPNVTSEEILEALKPSSELRHLRIENYPGCMSPSWLTNHSIECLESIRLSKCKAWEELPNFGQLMYLKVLYLSNLPKVKAFGPQFHGCGPLEGFPSLKVMHVMYMDGLETWDWGERCNAFPYLEELNVRACPQLVKFSLWDAVKVHKESTKWFPMLDQLVIRDCPQLPLGRIEKMSDGWIRIELVKGPKVLDLISWTFKNIHSMTIYECSNLTSLLWKCICKIHGLKELTFYNCHELCFSPAVQEEKNDGSTSYTHESLQKLVIDYCSVTGEELSYLLAHVPALCELSISRCNGIGPISLSSSKVEPNRSSMVADVEVDKDQQQSSNSLMCLEKLIIEACPNLVFVNEGGLSGLAALKRVSIYDFDKLLSSMIQEQGSNCVQTLHVERSNLTSLNLYNFVALRELKLRYCKYLASVEGPNSPARLEVYIVDCPQLAKTQSQIEPKFLMAVEELSIANMEFLSIHANSLSMSLHSLTIESSEGQLELWSEWTEEQENAVIKHLTALEELTLSYCTKLRSLPSTLHLHPSLRELTIKVCPEIKSLPQGGFPKTLQKLRLGMFSEELKSQCSQLEDFERCEETNHWGYLYDVFSKRDPSAN